MVVCCHDVAKDVMLHLSMQEVDLTYHHLVFLYVSVKL